MKITLLALAVIGLMVRGYFMYQANQVKAAKQVLATRQTVNQIRNGMHGPDAEADAAARGKDGAPSKPSAPAAPATVAPSGDPADVAQRQEVEASLRAMHLTTIMPGQPGLVIIDKQEYSEGEELPVGKGRKAKIVSVQDDGVKLTCGGMAFHLDAPAAPDLAAMRKKK